jgi:hypothetical protein
VSNGGSTITSYVVTPYIGATAQPSTTGAASPVTVTGLTNGTAYTFTVAATNSTGTGPASAPSAAVTPATLPGAPTGVSAVAGNAQATVSFTPPASNGGATISGYTITPYVGATAQAPRTAAGSPATVTGLTNGTTYTFTVSATNSVGSGPASAPSNAVTPATVPGTPTGVSAVAGNAQATVSFTPPVSNGGATITGYIVTPYIGATAQPSTTGTASPVTVTSLTNGTTYTFRVAATNSAGTGPASVASNPVTPVTVPGPPTNVIAVAGNAQAIVSFTPPASNGGAAVTSYTVTPYIGATPQAPTTGTTTPISVSGLVNGTTYTFTVAATNSVGTGAVSAPSNPITPAPPPVGTAVTLISVGSQDGWVLESSEASGVGGSLNSSSSNGNAIRVGDDSGDRQYKGVLSFDTSSIPDGATITGTRLELTRGGGAGMNPFTSFGALNVDVRSGPFNGNPALEAGDYEAAQSAAVVATMSSVVSNGQVSSGSFNAAGLGAVNKTGTTQVRIYFTLDDNDDLSNDYVSFYSGEDNTASDRPRLIVTYTVAPTVPGAPTGVTAEAGNAQATVSFAPPASDGGSPITGYVVTPYIGGIAQGTTAGTTSPITVTGLANGTTYTFTVAATNVVGSGPATASSNAVTPSDQPVTLSFASVGGQDGWVLESNEASNTGGSLESNSASTDAIRVGDDGKNRQYKSVLSFDTSAIPDRATITSVTLEVTRGSVTGTNPYTTHGALTVDIRSGGFNGNVALEAGDFQGAATAVGTAALSAVTSNGQVASASLGAAGLAALNKSGTTQVRIYFALDDDNDRSADYIGFYSGANGTAANRPRLIVTYMP